MKFLEKVKNMFTEEVEEEVKPIKTEVRKVEIPAPVKPPVKETSVEEEKNISENETLKKEEKFKFPVYFDEKDFDKLPSASAVEKKEEPKRVTPVVPKKEPPKEPVRKEAYGGRNPAFSASIVKEEKKVFKPTPIISPVYGVLDKNYKKEDITPKKRVETRVSKELTVDDIRNKAFGTLEDDLETTLFGKSSILFNNEVESSENDPLDLFDELDAKVEEPRHGKTEEESTMFSRAEKNKELEFLNEVEELEDLVINERPETEKKEEAETSSVEVSSDNMIEEEMDKICSDLSLEEKSENDIEYHEASSEEKELTESDLFNLIDSMYEKKDGEE